MNCIFPCNLIFAVVLYLKNQCWRLLWIFCQQERDVCISIWSSLLFSCSVFFRFYISKGIAKFCYNMMLTKEQYRTTLIITKIHFFLYINRTTIPPLILKIGAGYINHFCLNFKISIHLVSQIYNF